MATQSTIEWTDKTWNPVVGCEMVSPGCARCYAEPMSARLASMAAKQDKPGRKSHYLRVINNRRRWNGHIDMVEEAVNDPLNWKRPAKIFVNSMSDLFHAEVPDAFIHRIFDVMVKAHWHQFQILTKRSVRLAEMSPTLPWAPNIWQGVSVESDAYTHRIDDLRRTGASVKFLSLEPLLGRLPKLDLTDIGWVIVGGEAGRGCRPMNGDWVRDIRDQCLAVKAPFFFKQWGHLRNNPDHGDPTAKDNGGTAKGGRTLDGVVWDEMPARVGKTG